MLNFDLQLFDEEIAENSVETQAEENSAENSQAQLPEGFEGLEEFKDEILQEIAQNEQAQEIPVETHEEKISDETPQYKTADEEIAALKAQIDELKKQGAKETPKPQEKISTPQTPKFQQPTTPPPQMQVTPEFMKAFNQATDAVAMKMTGMTAQDVKDLEFAEDGDEALARWKFAKQQAAYQVRADIQAAQLRMQQEQAFNANVVKNYDDFIAKEKSDADFANVVVLAAGNLFASLPEVTQQTLANAFAKVEHRQATPAEFLLVQNYFTQAKELYKNEKNKTPKNNQSARKAAETLPKADQINGANANNYGGLSVKDLEKIIDETTDFDKLDPKIKKMFEG